MVRLIGPLLLQFHMITLAPKNIFFSFFLKWSDIFQRTLHLKEGTGCWIIYYNQLLTDFQPVVVLFDVSAWSVFSNVGGVCFSQCRMVFLSNIAWWHTRRQAYCPLILSLIMAFLNPSLLIIWEEVDDCCYQSTSCKKDEQEILPISSDRPVLFIWAFCWWCLKSLW